MKLIINITNIKLSYKTDRLCLQLEASNGHEYYVASLLLN